MPPLLLLIAVGAGAYFGMKWANRDKGVARKNTPSSRNTKSAKGGQRTPKEAENLKQDPVSGVYRVDD